MVLYCAALIEGRDFKINIDGKHKNSGFFSTFYYEIDDADEAKSRLLEMLKERIKNSNIEFVRSNDHQPYILIKHLHGIEKDEMKEAEGFTFYVPSLKDKMADWLNTKLIHRLFRKKNVLTLE